MTHLLSEFRSSCSRLDGLCVSKIFGHCTVLGACLYKAPIIYKIIKTGNGSGLNPLSIYMETSAYGVLVLYNRLMGNAISTYGDYFLSSSQNVIIILLLWMWGVGPKDPRQITSRHIQTVIAVSAILVAVLYRSQHWLEANGSVLTGYAYAVITASRVPQIYRNHKTGVVGVQSLITLCNAVIGSAGKVFIAINETKDMGILYGSLLTVVVNLSLALQVLMLKGDSSISLNPKQKVQPKGKTRSRSSNGRGANTKTNLNHYESAAKAEGNKQTASPAARQGIPAAAEGQRRSASMQAVVDYKARAGVHLLPKTKPAKGILRELF